MKIMKEFREFAVKGNVVDMGIGVIIGTAFGKIVDSLVSDILMPPIGLVLGKVDFSHLYINLSGQHFKSLSEAKEAGAATINYGHFFNSVIHFTIVAFATFITIRQVNRLRNLPFESLTAKECPFCFSNIPTRAIRCPNCTSVIENKLSDMADDRQVKISIRSEKKVV